MAKKSSGKHYTSRGERPNVSSRTLKGMKRMRGAHMKLFYIQKAWHEGKNPWVTIDNPNPNETNKRKIRVKSNTIWGSPKELKKKMFRM